MLQENLEALLAEEECHFLPEASQCLTESYLRHASLSSWQECLAYLVVRMPATYAVLMRVLVELPERPRSFLDIGAGPATLFWAAKALWQPAPVITAVEREPYFIELGQRLGAKVEWKAVDCLHIEEEKWAEKIQREDSSGYEWAVFSYSLGEFPVSSLESLLKFSWQSVTHGVIFIEPGTPAGWQTVLHARDLLLSWGASVSAPCPHSQQCPLEPGHWCHFSVRLARQPLHRWAKRAALSFEDEKFSYMILSKSPLPVPEARLIGRPRKHAGHLVLPLCTRTGILKRTLSRRQGHLYKQGRKAQWGERWDEPPNNH